MLKRFTYLFLFALFVCSASAQVTVRAWMDTNAIVVGEQTQIHLRVSYPANSGNIQIMWPNISDTIIDKIEVVDRSKIDTTIPDKNAEVLQLEQHQDIVITSFDSGFYAIPPFKFIVNGDTSRPLETEAMLFQVNNIQVDTTQAIRDVKAPMDAPFTIQEILPYLKWIFLGWAILTLLIYIIWYITKNNKKTVVVKTEPDQPPHIIALEELNRIRAEQIWQQGKIKVYYTSVTDVLRVYIEKRFKVHAMEQTSDEIMQSMRSIVIDAESKQRLRQVLLLADMVKFAKAEPLPGENEMSIQHAIDFVEGTKREEETNNEEEIKP